MPPYQRILDFPSWPPASLKLGEAWREAQEPNLQWTTARSLLTTCPNFRLALSLPMIRETGLRLRSRMAIGRSMGSQLEDEIESWKGFPWALRKEDREFWDEMVDEVRQGYAEAVELSRKQLTTHPFFMALILAQQRTIERLKAQLRETGRLTKPTF